MKEVKDYVTGFLMVLSLVWVIPIGFLILCGYFDIALASYIAFLLVFVGVAIIYSLLAEFGLVDKINFYLSVGRYAKRTREAILNAPIVTIDEYRVTVKLAKHFYSIIEGEEACLLARGKEKVPVRATIFYDKDGNKIYIKPIEIVTNPTKRAS